MQHVRVLYCAVALAVGALLVAGSVAASTKTRSGEPPSAGASPGDVHHDVSPPLRDLVPAPTPQSGKKKVKEPKKGPPIPAQSLTPDPVVQSTPASAAAPALGLGFEGIGEGFSGPAGTFAVDSAPPDPNATVGPNNVVEIVNESFAVFDKSGNPVYGPVPTNTLWSGFGGGCQSNNDGDATVVYDKLAGRWVFSQFSVSTTPYLQCVAVSTSGDPTGSYYRYAFSYTKFPDYPKLGVWPDAYYVSFNLFKNGVSYAGPEVCAYNRARMLLGQAATQKCFTKGTSYGSLLPADLDGSTAPPSGSPEYFLSFGTNTLQLWKFHVNWTTPSSSTFTGPTNISVAPFSPACGGGECIPQPDTAQELDSLGDRLMYRLAYRNFGDHQALVVNHSVTAGGSVGVRWYELRNPSGTPTVFQQSTYAPDSANRWMGSIAMDHAGNIALGYSTSSSSLHPGIRYTGRLALDPPGVMTQGEGTLIDGGGSQTGVLARWGDYTSMSVDPADDCTFWYTGEYLASYGSFNWHTRIGSFSLPGCTTAPSDFSIGASPSSLSVAQGSSGTSTISTAVTSGSAQAVSLSASGQPAGTTVGFSPSTVTAGGSSTMTVNVGASTAPGAYTITVTGTSAGATHTTTVGLTVGASDFSIGASPSSLSVPQGSSGSSMIGTAVTSGVAQSVNLSATGAPAGTTVGFNPPSITAGGSSPMTVSVGGGTATGIYTITVTGTGASTSHSTPVTLTVTAAPASDFSISATPSSLTVAQGASGTSTIGTGVLGGSAQTISLSASGGPAGTTLTLDPSSVTSGGSSTLTVAVGATAPPGSYTIKVTGTSPTATHSVDVSLTVVGSGVANGGFESGNLNGWSADGAYTPVITTSAHSGGYSARVGSTSAVQGDSTLTQTVAIPSGGSRLTFWYQPHCTDSITFDQIQMQIRNTAGATVATVLNVCELSNAWTSVTFDTSVFAGQNVVLWFNDHDDGYANDPTYFLLDDVAISAYVPTPNVVQNAGFETGSLSPWSASGAFLPVVSTTAHSGSYSSQLGSTSAVNGNSTLTQTVTVPTGAPTLTFSYQPHCKDAITYDQIQMQVRSTSGATLATVLNVCSNSGVWTQVSFDLTPYAGQTVVLWFNDHDDGVAVDPTYFLLDDVVLGGS